MNIAIRGIREKGVLDDERIVLDVSRPTDVGRYFLSTSTSQSEGGVSSAVGKVFWFPDKPVKAKDVIVLYTKKGTTSEKKNDNGGMSHFFYWGLKNTVWDAADAAAVLARIADWESVKVR